MIADEKGSPVDQRTRRQLRSLLFMAPALGLVMAVFIAAAPWLKATFGAPFLILASVALSVLVLGASEYFAFRFNRGLDEVERASQGFAVRWGASAGQFVFVVLLILPPFRDVATAIVNEFAGDAIVDRGVVTLAMVFGLACLVLLQTIGTFVISVIWWMRTQQ